MALRKQLERTFIGTTERHIGNGDNENYYPSSFFESANRWRQRFIIASDGFSFLSTNFYI